MASEDEHKLYNHLRTIGCCKRCILRYLGLNKNFVSFEAPETSLANLGLLSLFDEMGATGPDCKKVKNNPCIACVGLLQDDVLEQMFAHPGLANAAKFQTNVFEIFITFPICAYIRDHSVMVYLKQHCTNIFKKENVVPIRKALKFTIETRLSKILSKKFQAMAPLSLHFYTSYILDNEETDVLRRGMNEKLPLSRHRVLKIFETIQDDDFKKLILVPPNIPLYQVKFDDFQFYSEAIYLLGTYHKYSRDSLLRQIELSPICEKPTMHDLLSNAVKSIVKKFGGFQFHTSTLDDTSVRTLGEGKAFTIYIGEPSFSSISFKSIKKIEHLVNQSPDFRIKNLRQVIRKDASQAIEVEGATPKSLRLLIYIFECKNIDNCVSAINMYRTIKVTQLTPLRLMTHRPLKYKAKMVYKIKAQKVSEKLLIVDICIEAGLHILEFINGDFGRTKPSLCEIINGKADVLAIDVLDLHMTICQEESSS